MMRISEWWRAVEKMWRQVEPLSFQSITGSFGGADLGKDFFYVLLLYIIELSNRADFIAKIYI